LGLESLQHYLRGHEASPPEAPARVEARRSDNEHNRLIHPRSLKPQRREECRPYKKPSSGSAASTSTNINTGSSRTSNPTRPPRGYPKTSSASFPPRRMSPSGCSNGGSTPIVAG